MANGRTLTLLEATTMIGAFVTQESVRTGYNNNDLAVGQKFDLKVINDFLIAIKDHELKDRIDGIRIYLAKSKRIIKGVEKELYDVVLVPVLDDDNDLHKVYIQEGFIGELPTLIGNGLPCPNVCPSGSLLCK